MDIVQNFYDNLASSYYKLFDNWNDDVKTQAEMMQKIFNRYGVSKTATVLDCAAGIGTQAIGLSKLNYSVTASDISEKALLKAKTTAKEYGVNVTFKKADFRELSSVILNDFNVVIAMDNALPHALTEDDLKRAVNSIISVIKDDGIFVGSIRDYDALLKDKPPYSPPYIHKTESGQRVCFQTWNWKCDNYELTQYIIEDENGAEVKTSKFSCEYRAVTREELTRLFINGGCKKVDWLFPEETGFYQPIIVASK